MESTHSEPRAAETGVVRGCRVETSSIERMLRLADRPRFAWVGATTTAGGGSAATVTADGADRFEHARTEGQRLLDRLQVPDRIPPGARPRLYGGFAFDHTRDAEDGRWTGFPGARFVLPAVWLSLTDDGPWLTATALGPDAPERATTRLDRYRDRLADCPTADRAPSPTVCARSCTPSRAGWRRRVDRVLGRIAAGDLEKVVLAQSATVRLNRPPDLVAALAQLGVSYPDCYRFLFGSETGGTFLGATPEQLVSVDGGDITTEALAGSTDRGDTAAADERLAARLRASEKNRHEHDLVVAFIRDRLSGLGAEVSTGERAVRRLATVQHLRTPIRARAAGSRHVLDVVEALHPTPAVGGLPPDAARAASRGTEAFDRGWYAAPVGWFDGAGDGTFAVAIRSGVMNGRSVTTFAGAGIVADSDPDREWDELQLKHRPVLDALS